MQYRYDSVRRGFLRIALAVAFVLSGSTVTHAQLQPVGGQFRIDSSAGGFQSGSGGVRHFSDGSFIVIWPDSSFQEFSRIQRFNADGTKSGTEFGVEPAGRVGDIGTPDSGNLIAIGQNQNTFTDLVGRIYDSSGTAIGSQFAVNTYTTFTHRQENARVEPLPGGNFVVVWQSLYGFGPSAEADIRGQRFDSTGAMVGTEFEVSNAPGSAYNNPVDIDSDSAGAFVVVWATLARPGGSNGGDINARVYDANGDAVTTPVTVNTDTADTDSQPSVGKRNDGSFIVAWSRQSGDPDASILMRIFDSTGTPQTPELIGNTYTTGDQTRPAVATDSDGGFVVTWASDGQDGFGNAVVARSFDSGGLPQGSGFLVNTYTQSDQDYASVSGDGSGNFVVAWTGDRAGYSYGVTFPIGLAGQRYVRQGGGGNPTLEFTVDTTGVTWTDNTPFAVPLSVTAQGGGFTGVTMTAVVPTRTTFTAASSTAGWSCPDGSAPGTECSFDVGALGDGQNVTATFASTVDAGTPSSWEVVVRGRADAGGQALTASTRGGPFTRILSVGVPSFGCLGNQNPSSCSFCACLFQFSCTGPALLTSLVSHVGALLDAVRGIGSDPVLDNYFSLRDHVLLPRRGGERASDLFLEHSAGMTTAMLSDPPIATDTMNFLNAFQNHVADLIAGNGDSAVVTQQQVDTLKVLLASLVAAADPVTAAAINRERARVDPDNWAGLTMTEALATFDRLTCMGFEGNLFCGEVNGDCNITATDALIILQIAVGAIPDNRVESDVDGSGATVATDALRALNIAVGAAQQTDECDPVI